MPLVLRSTSTHLDWVEEKLLLLLNLYLLLLLHLSLSCLSSKHMTACFRGPNVRHSIDGLSLESGVFLVT